mmetsp:Transcript_13705/g.39087  ORF Transcript_13705/g.39087 Transcript_13705/m.39087 type:complete len:158 (-) Transcript_13705:143-616(-)
MASTSLDVSAGSSSGSNSVWLALQGSAAEARREAGLCRLGMAGGFAEDLFVTRPLASLALAERQDTAGPFGGRSAVLLLLQGSQANRATQWLSLEALVPVLDRRFAVAAPMEPAYREVDSRRAGAELRRWAVAAGSSSLFGGLNKEAAVDRRGLNKY